MHRLLAILLSIAVYANLDAQPCPEPTYHKTYRIDNGQVSTENSDAQLVPGDILYAAGDTYIETNGIVYVYGTLEKYDNTGALLWQKAYASGHESTDSWTGFSHIISTADNNLMLSGLASVSFYESNPMIQKTDLNGNPIWTKIFPDFETYTTEMTMTALPDGGLAYTFGPMMVGKLDQNGVPVWTKSFQYAGNTPPADATGDIVYGDGALYVSFGITEANQHTDVHLLKLNPDNGAVIWERQINNPAYSINFTQLYVNNNMLYMPYRLDSSFYLQRTNGRIRMDENGNLQDVIHFILPTPSPFWMNFTKNDPFVVSTYLGVPNKIGLTRIPSEGYVEWAHDYSTPSYETQMISIADLSTGSYLAISDYWLPTDYGGSVWLTRVNSGGQTPGCPATDTVIIPIQHISLPFTDDNLQSSDIIPNLQNYQLTITSQDPVEADVCNGQDVCNTLTVNPHSSVCGLGDTVTFTANQGSTCTLAVGWSYDTSAATIVSAGISSISLVFHKAGAFQLTGTLQTSCQLLNDNTTFNVYDSPEGLDLGPDRVLCQGTLDTLHAGKSFMSYSWQDGSTDSIYYVSAPGNYAVTVTSYCNEQFTDAIQLLPPATVNFDLGPGVTICPGDTTTIIPPAGYSGYSWFPDYNELTAALPSLSVYPYQDTTYTCTALTTQGCRVADSIRVQLAKVQPIDLGGAVSICPDGQDTLDAGGGFISYLWSTGETTRQITVNQPAQYSVEATNPNNSCISRASVTVSWHNVLKPDLGPDISLCTDSSHLFNAGKGYMTYLWQDGSTNATLIATQPGEYWVQVVDSNGCSAGDTVEVIGKAYCLIGIHFPNAFTPNGDGKNDTFKAILSGSLDTYHLAIFDRYGEIVFETNDPGKGWDGRYKNISRPAGTFVWYATYHFSGSSEPATMQKGTLELIR